VYVYDDAQKEKLDALREVCLRRLRSRRSISPSKTSSTILVFTLFFHHFSIPTHFAYPTMTRMRHGSAAGLTGRTPSHATYVLPSGSSMMHGSESRAPSNGGANSSQNSSHLTRSRSRLRQGRCECAPVLFFPCRHVCTIRGASLLLCVLMSCCDGQYLDGLRCGRPTDYLYAARTREYGDVPTSTTASRVHSVCPASLALINAR